MKYFKLFKGLLTLLALFFLVFSCKNDDNNNLPEEPEKPWELSEGTPIDSILAELGVECFATGALQDFSYNENNIIPGVDQLENIDQIGTDEEKTITRGTGYIISGAEDLPYFAQGQYGSCVPSSLCNMINIFNKKITGMPYKKNNLYDDYMVRTFSVAFLHHKATKGEVKKGASIENVISILQTEGVPTSADWPYKNVEKNPQDADIVSKARFNSFINHDPGFSFLSIKDNDKNDIYIKDLLRRGSPVSFHLTFLKSALNIANSLYKDGGESLKDSPNKTITQSLLGGKSRLDVITPKFFEDFYNLKLVEKKDSLVSYKELSEADMAKAKTSEQRNAVYLKYNEAHQLLIIGYDDSKRAFMVLNTWNSSNIGGTINIKDETNLGEWFWLSYDILDKTKNNFKFGDYYPLSTLGRNMVTVGIQKIGKYAKNGSLFYDFNGYEKYKDVTTENYDAHFKRKTPLIPANYNESSFTYGNAGVRLQEGSMIKFPRETVIPKYGTIEFDVFVQGGYTDQYVTKLLGTEQLNNTLHFDDRACLFSCLIDRQTSKDEFTGQTPIGGMQLRVNKIDENQADIILKYGNATFDDYLETGNSNILRLKRTMPFKFNAWNKIGLSFSNKEMYIIVNGLEMKIANGDVALLGNAQFIMGYATTINDVWDTDEVKPWEIMKKGTNYITKEGFIGAIRAFRTSENDKDWVLSLN